MSKKIHVEEEIDACTEYIQRKIIRIAHTPPTIKEVFEFCDKIDSIVIFTLLKRPL